MTCDIEDSRHACGWWWGALKHMPLHQLACLQPSSSMQSIYIYISKSEHGFGVYCLGIFPCFLVRRCNNSCPLPPAQMPLLKMTLGCNFFFFSFFDKPKSILPNLMLKLRLMIKEIWILVQIWIGFGGIFFLFVEGSRYR